MAIHELYLGGGRTTNSDFAMFPSPTFSQSGTITAAAHKGSHPIYVLNRTLDFRDDPALVAYARGATFSAGDYLGSVITPDDTFILGCHLKVERAVTGVTLLVRLRQDASTLIATYDAGTAGSVFYGMNGTQVATGTPAAVQGLYLNNSDIVDIELDALPVDGVQDLRVTVGVIVIDPRAGQW